MAKKIVDDLRIFNSLVADLLKEEKEKGISTRIEADKLFDQLDISLSDNAMDDEGFIKILRELILNTPKTSGKLFFNQLYGGRESKSVLGDLLAVILNNSMATYKIAGPMVAVEKEIINKICELISYPQGSGGTFPTGGSMSNFMALIIARDKKNAEIKNKGNISNLICYSSENSHYSIGKNASFSGIGRDNVRYISTNEKGEMIPSELNSTIENDIQNGLTPFFVNATVGTTVMGAIDPISEISEICRKHNIWLHIDGAYAGTVIFSEKYKHLVKGVEHSDSFCFNAHKTLGTPISTSIFVLKNEKDLCNSFSNEASYLYQTDNSKFNLGQISFECGRRNNALKFWTLWKSVGTNGIAKMVEQNYDLANLSREYIKSNSDYKLYSYDYSLSICFNYKNINPEKICTELYHENKLMVSFGVHKKDKFIRLVSINRENTKEDILNFFKVFEEFADNMK